MTLLKYFDVKPSCSESCLKWIKVCENFQRSNIDVMFLFHWLAVYNYNFRKFLSDVEKTLKELKIL